MANETTVKAVPKDSSVVNWDAREYIPQDKNGGWYVGLVVVSLALIALAVVFSWWTFVVVVVLSAVA